ncbi:hypothetical protein N865_05860 [Intrasporangium oryzae NRRL B-24470]|uniref:EF-hand domain-containing protein n=1 Tax=Intrasporangium oryzae NRRL B-24470 TaxID=1386089 RepID=W9G6L8_9MICO|nr:hypothetical protein [Intrasporangium oryzae]EWT00952.1 hypothetical protein N865_05860 [Intrasporangium oryzae NRRL B-24470]
MQRNLIRALALAALGAGSMVAGTAAAQASGVSGPAFYIDHELYRTVATPTDLSGTGAPAQSWDTIYSFSGLQRSVATAAPGDPGFNGGRWQVHAVSPTGTYAAALAAGDLDGDGVLDAANEVQAAIAAGALVDNGVVKYFVCTVNKVPAGGA